MTQGFFNSDNAARTIDISAVENALIDLLVRVMDADLQQLNVTKGVMRLVDASVQAEVLAQLSMRPAEVELGGSAANALRCLAMLGVQTSYSSVVGKDKYGESFARRLKELSIINRLVLSDLPTGTCLVAVTPDGERTLNTHLGACREYKKEHLPLEDIKRSKIFFTTGYCWDTPNQIEAIDHAIHFARDNGAKIALDVADPFVVKRSKDVFLRLINTGMVDILFANAEEANTLLGCKGMDALKLLANKITICAIKDGANGAYMSYEGKLSHVPAMPTTVVDTTGAGDMFAAGVMYGILNGLSIDLCGKIGTMLASDVISYLGVRLSSDVVRTVHDLLK